MGRRRAKDKQVEVLAARDIDLAAEECGLQGSKTKVYHVDTNAPGLRKCQYCDSKTLTEKIREVAK